MPTTEKAAASRYSLNNEQCSHYCVGRSSSSSSGSSSSTERTRLALAHSIPRVSFFLSTSLRANSALNFSSQNRLRLLLVLFISLSLSHTLFFSLCSLAKKTAKRSAGPSPPPPCTIPPPRQPLALLDTTIFWEREPRVQGRKSSLAYFYLSSTHTGTDITHSVHRTHSLSPSGVRRQTTTTTTTTRRYSRRKRRGTKCRASLA